MLCYPSAFIHLCTIFPLVSFNSPALLHTLPCWLSTWARGCHGPLDAEVGLTAGHHQRELPRAEFPLNVSSRSCLSPPLLVEFSNNKNDCRNLSLKLLLPAGFGGNQLRQRYGSGGRKEMGMDNQTGTITTMHTSCPRNPD